MLIPKRTISIEYKRLLRKINKHGILSREVFFNVIGSKSKNYIPVYFQEKIIPSITHKSGYFISQKFLKKHSDRYGFYHTDSGITFNVHGDIISVLKYLIRARPAGLSASEARKLCNRDCHRPLAQIEKLKNYSYEPFGKQKIYYYNPKKKKQLKNRIVDSRIVFDHNEESSDDEILLEDIGKTLKEVIGSSFSYRKLIVGLLKVHLDSSWRQLGRQFKYIERYRKIAEIEEHENPHYTTLNNYLLTLPIADLEELFKMLVAELKSENTITGKYLAMDASHIFAWSNHSNPMFQNPYHHANYYTEDSILHLAQPGYHVSHFFGYKCHILIDCEAELPVAVAITSGNISDMTQIVPLIDNAEAIDLQEVLLILGDAGYDFSDDIEIVNTMIKGKMIVDTNPRNCKFLKNLKKMVDGVFDKFEKNINDVDDALKYLPQKQLTDFGIKICSKKESALVKLIQYRLHRGLRVAVERVFSRLKTCLPFERPKLQKDTSILKNIYLCLNWMLLVALTAKRVKCDKSIRKMASVV
jgi:hypothetical protein